MKQDELRIKFKELKSYYNRTNYLVETTIKSDGKTVEINPWTNAKINILWDKKEIIIIK